MHEWDRGQAGMRERDRELCVVEEWICNWDQFNKHLLISYCLPSTEKIRAWRHCAESRITPRSSRLAAVLESSIRNWCYQLQTFWIFPRKSLLCLQVCFNMLLISYKTGKKPELECQALLPSLSLLIIIRTLKQRYHHSHLWDEKAEAYKLNVLLKITWQQSQGSNIVLLLAVQCSSLSFLAVFVSSVHTQPPYHLPKTV